jgi:putative ABC transport system substrate-binding protein
MKRREFITLLGGAVAAWPLAARAQQPTMPVVGYLSARSRNSDARFVFAFQEGLRESGYVQGQNLAVEYRWADNRYDRLPVLAAELIAQPVRVLAAIGVTAASAAKGGTSTVPIVFGTGADPIKSNLVSSLNRPEGNLTGVSYLGKVLVSKQLELLRDLIRSPAAVGFMVNPKNAATEGDVREAENAVLALGQRLVIVEAGVETGVGPAFTSLVQQRARAFLIQSDPFFNGVLEHLVELSVHHRLPAISPLHEFAIAGGLMSYGSSLTDMSRQVGVYASRILNGARPADLPVQQATKVELIVNLRSAQALGLEVPQSLLARADEVIE